MVNLGFIGCGGIARHHLSKLKTLANAKVVARSLQGVLLVPNRAITADRQTGKYFVSRLQGQQTAQVEVKIGLRDESSTQVIEGLQEGDKLVLGTDRALNLMAGRPQGMSSAVH